MRNLILLAAFCAALPLAAQESSSQQPDKPQAPALEKPGMAAPEPEKKPEAKKPAEPKKAEIVPSKTVEEIIARVNNEIITRSEFDKARAAAEEDAKQECQGKCTPEQLRTDIEDRQKNTLRDLIDQSLLVQRGKDMGVNVEPEVIKKLDQLRQQKSAKKKSRSITTSTRRNLSGRSKWPCVKSRSPPKGRRTRSCRS